MLIKQNTLFKPSGIPSSGVGCLELLYASDLVCPQPLPLCWTICTTPTLNEGCRKRFFFLLSWYQQSLTECFTPSAVLGSGDSEDYTSVPASIVCNLVDSHEETPLSVLVEDLWEEHRPLTTMLAHHGACTGPFTCTASLHSYSPGKWAWSPLHRGHWEVKQQLAGRGPRIRTGPCGE
jgi:hypothetical protein